VKPSALPFISLCLWTILSVASASGQSTGRPHESITIALKWQHQFQFAGYYAAIEQGFFAEEGLQVTLTTPDDFRFPDVTVASGAAEYGVGISDILISRAAGYPFVVVAAIFQHSPVVLVSLADNNYIYPSSFIDKRIEAIGLARREIIALFQREGVNPDNVIFLDQARDLTAFVHGEPDGIIGYITDLPYQLQQRGVVPRLLRPIDYGIDFYGDLLFTTENEIRNKPHRVAAVKRAVLRGWEYALENSEELIDYILTLPGVQERGFTRGLLQYEAAKTIELIQPVLVELGHINPGRWEKIANMYADQGLMPHDFSLEGFIYSPVESDGSLQKVLRLAGALITFLLLIVMVISLFAKQKLVWLKRKYQRNESLFRAISANFENGFMYQLDTGKIGEIRDFLFISDGVTEILGYTPQQIVADSSLMYAGLATDDRRILSDKEAESIVNGKTLTAEIKLSHTNGALRWCQITSIPHREPAGHLIWDGIVLDITERRQSEEFRKRVFESSILPIVVMDAASFKYLDCNQAAVEMYKFNSKAETLGKTPLDVSAPFQYDGTSSAAKALTYINEALEKGSVVFEWLHQRPDGELWDAEVHLLSFAAEGKTLLQFSLLDISERKRVAQMLESSESRLRATLENTPNVAIQWCDLEGKIVYWNHASETFYGFSSAEAIGKTLDQLFYSTEDFQRFLTILQEVNQTGSPYGPYESRIQLADGRQGIVLATTFGIELEPGKTGFVCMDLDITELKQAEESLKTSEARYRSVITVSNTGVWEFNKSTGYLWCSPEYFQMLGLNQKDFMMNGTANLEQTWLNLLHPDDQKKAADHFAQYLKNGSVGMYENFFRMKHTDGGWVWIWSRGQTLRNPDGSVSELTIGTHINITDIKQMEQMLKIERNNFEVIFESSPIAILVLDESSKIIRANAAAVGLSGGDESRVLHHQPGDAFHCAHSFEAGCGHGTDCPLCPVRNGIEDLISGSGEPIDKAEIQLSVLREKKEHTIWLEISSAEMLLEDKRAFIILLDDITERKKAEAEIKLQYSRLEALNEKLSSTNRDLFDSESRLSKSLSEKETLLREVYHRTNNTLMVIQSIIRLQAEEFSANPDVAILVTNTENRIQAISLVHQMLYESQDLSLISIKDYVQDCYYLLKESYNITGNEISLRINIVDQKLVLDTVIPLGLVLNELITNSFKHAFADKTEGTIEIELSKVNNNIYVLEYSDNGVGVPAGFDFKNCDSLGIRLIHMIGEGQMSGKIHMESKNGIRCLLEFPVNLYKARV